MEEYFKTNQVLWDQKTAVHAASDFYDMEGFMNGKTSLQEIELNALANRVKDQSLLHLQCHFGQDSLSWARLGAKVTGVDLSGESIKLARQLNEQLKLDATFLQSNVLKLKGKIDQQFDFVFTSYGTTIWLPDLKEWASTINHYLKPGGTFYIVDFHPAFMVFDHDNHKIAYDYFHSSEPVMEEIQGTYANRESAIKSKEYFWSHSLHQTMNALLDQGLKLKAFEEYPFSPYKCFENMAPVSPGRFVYKEISCSFPHTYAIEVYKEA